ncbi:DUF1772 domain-containing protein [Nocardioides sp. NPDC127514]|uniref:DUF1772 domain-containing protein n=1 Tax=unclassified Nocardioides TaxID=2615069 RepID=UPI0033235C47
MTALLRRASLLFTGLFAGFLVAVLVLELSLRDATATVYTEVRLVELENLDKLATATLLPAVLITAALLLRTFRGGGPGWPAATGLTLLVAILILTVSVNLPINADQLDWHPQSPPADWKTVRDTWQLAHATRTLAAVLAFVVLLVPGDHDKEAR